MTDRVALDDPPRASLLALLMRDLLAANLAEEALWARARGMRGDVRVEAGGMSITLRFAPDGATVLTGPQPERPRATVRGTLGALMGVSTGQGLVGPFLSGALGFGGNPLFLLRLLPLLGAPDPPLDTGAAP